MSSRKKKEVKPKEDDFVSPTKVPVEPAEVDRAAEVVDRVLRESGADSSGIKGSEGGHGATMKALLHHYTHYASLMETDEHGEHLLTPSTRDISRGEIRARPRQQTSTDMIHTDGGDEAAQQGDEARLEELLRHLDHDAFVQIKQQFQEHGNAMNCNDFINMIRGHISHVDIGDDKQVEQTLTQLHATLVASGAGQGQQTSMPATVADAVFQTEVIAEQSVGAASWQDFADLLLGKGIVGEKISSFNVVNVLSHIDLDDDKMDALEREFALADDTVTLETFVIMMKKQFSHIFSLTDLFDLQTEERRLLGQLVNLFEMIDLGGSGYMSWDDFTTFLVEQGMTEDVVREFNLIRLEKARIQCDGSHHKSFIKSAYYFEHYDKVVAIEADSRALKLFTPELTKAREPLEFSSSPICVEYIDKYKFLAVSCTDKSLNFYDTESNLGKLVRSFQLGEAALVMCWSESGGALFSADHDGRIYAWDMQQVRKGPERKYEPGQGEEWKEYQKADIARQEPMMRHISDEAHTGGGSSSADRQKHMDPMRQHHCDHAVMALCELSAINQLASCGMDTRIMIWCVFSGILKQKLKGHKMGVQCMAFAPLAKVLVTGGYDYKLFVWNPYVGKSIQTITGHLQPIVGIEVLGAASHQIVSADSSGTMRCWDLSSYQLLQILSIDDVKPLRAFISVPPHGRVLAADRKFIAYDYLTTGAADQTDEHPIIKAFYNPRLQVFVSGCSSHLRVWDASTGLIKCVIQHPDHEKTEHVPEITDFCMDDRGRKLFVADHNGEVHVHNSTTGAKIKSLTPHDEEVSGCIYCPGDGNLLTVSWDRSIFIHDESAKLPKVWRRATNVHTADITCVAFSRRLGLIATGSNDTVISVREYERMRTMTTLLGHSADITALAFVDPLPLLVSADVGGNVAVWAVNAPSGRQPPFANEMLTCFTNMQSLESSAAVNCVEPVYEHATRRFSVWTGDEDGIVRAWDLSELLAKTDIQPCGPNTTLDPFKQDRFDNIYTAQAKAREAKVYEAASLPIKVREQVVRQCGSWKAHDDSVRTLKVYDEPWCIVTAGHDHMVKVWSHEHMIKVLNREVEPKMEPMTVLRAQGSQWKFPVQADMAGVDQATLDRVVDRVKRGDQQVVATTSSGMRLEPPPRVRPHRVSSEGRVPAGGLV